MCVASLTISNHLHFTPPFLSLVLSDAVGDRRMGMEQWCNDQKGKKTQYSEIYLSMCYFVHCKSYIDWPFD